MFKCLRAVSAGFTATTLMTVAIDRDPAKIDVPSILGSKVNADEEARRHSGAWMFGLALHYVLGSVVFPASFETVVAKLPIGSMTKSIMWGIGLWAFAETVVMPVLGRGKYFKKKTVAVKYLVGHLIYGSVYGLLRSKNEA